MVIEMNKFESIHKSKFELNRIAKLRKKAQQQIIEGKVDFKNAPEDLIELLSELNLYQIELEIQNEELSKSQADLESALDNYLDLYEFSPIGYISIDSDKIINSINLTGATKLGSERALILNTSFLRYICVDYIEIFMTHCDMALNNKSKLSCELMLKRKNNESFYALIESIYVNDPLQHNPQMRISIADISYQKAIELQLRKSEEKFRSIVETTNDWIWIVNSHGCYTYTNQRVNQILGYDPEDLKGKQRLEYICGYDHEIAEKLWQEVIENKIAWHDKVLQYKHKNRSSRYLESSVTLILDDYENIVNIIGTERDITERKCTDEWLHQHSMQLTQAARVSSMGELATALAHELNQPLTAIATYAGGLLKSLGNNNKNLYNVLYNINAQAERAGKIIHSLKNYICNGALKCERANINDVIKESILLADYLLRERRLNVQCEFEENLPFIRLDKIQVNQVIINLLKNSINAMEYVNVVEPLIKIKTQFDSDNMISVEISDSGPGIPAEIAAKVFEPYFTTSTFGLGIGLAICKTIIEAHEGKISLFYNLAGKAYIRFLLPII